MGNNPICTSLEQSERLLDLGIDTKTADMSYVLRNNQPVRLVVMTDVPDGMLQTIPAWSLSVLIDLLPGFLHVDNKDYVLTLLINRVVYWRPDADRLYETTQGCLLDAVVEAIEWLVTEGWLE